MIYTSYYGRIKRIPSDGFCVSIARFKPDWYNGYECTALAPSSDLLNRYKNGETSKEEYVKEFNKYLNTKNPVAFTNMVLNMSKGKDVFLLCYERPVEFCHRHLVRDWLNNAGIRCEEFTLDTIMPWEDI